MSITSETKQVGSFSEVAALVLTFVGLEDLDGPGVLADRFVVISAFHVDEANSSDHISYLEMMVLLYALVCLHGLLSC